MSERTFYFVFALSHVPEHGGENVSGAKWSVTRAGDKAWQDMKHKLKAYIQRIRLYTATVYSYNALEAR